jgi:KipI family sensor histidine kinase inhibitor
MSVRPFGDAALLLELEQRIDPSLMDTARGIADAWEARGFGEAVPTYASVLLRFDPDRMAWREALAAANALATEPAHATAPAAGRLIEIPTTYDGLDLAETAARSGLTPAELIELHAGREYRAFFLGFMPGLAYCGMLDPRIDAPRLASPRPRIAAGTVAVAAGQTLVYPVECPGGWRLIGRTDVAVFDPAREPAALIRAGDRLRFVPR